MAVPLHGLGGRLALLDPRSLTGAARTTYDTIEKTMVPWADKAGFEAKTPDGKLIGPFNSILLSPDITDTFLALQEAEQKHTTLSDRVRQVVILTVGAVWSCDYERYAHSAVARTAGLSDAAIKALVGDEPAPDLDDKEQCAQRFTRRLTAGHQIDDDLYAATEAAFGPQGIVDIIYLAGCYHTISALLNTFKVPAPEQQCAPWRRSMSHNEAPQATLTTAASFPVKYFLENLAMRGDHSVLVTTNTRHELWYVPPVDKALPVEPVLLHRFDQPTTNIVEVEPDIFYMTAGNIYTTHDCYLHRLDMRDWSPGSPPRLEQIFRFPPEARGPNGSCLLAPGVLLVADSFAGLIWRLDLHADGGKPKAGVWLKHDSMGYYPGKMKPEQPGENGVRYAAKTNHLYYTATAKKLLMRVAVDPDTLAVAGEPEIVVAGRMGDDFCIDEDAEVIYLGTHRQNTIDIVSMDPGLNSGFTQCVAGDPYTPELIGPSGGVWGRAPGDYGRVAYFITDGGTASPPPDGPRPAKLLRVELLKLPGVFPGTGS